MNCLHELFKVEKDVQVGGAGEVTYMRVCLFQTSQSMTARAVL
jgi:hypothetical protein